MGKDVHHLEGSLTHPPNLILNDESNHGVILALFLSLTFHGVYLCNTLLGQAFKALHKLP